MSHHPSHPSDHPSRDRRPGPSVPCRRHQPHRSGPRRPRPCSHQRGVTTAEYAVATAAGAGFAGLLFKLLTGGLGSRLITSLFDRVLSVLQLG
ncbi:DUF4244 domain-containing protein [Pimelobacter simplex]|uniref:DUF4244 domain-containing protein n=1 Tax=Nocardioides simplex TaxID=2045 RepID=UPI0021506B4E|nr:DUF4244 domain-containing protein [Pimelobacter simplex]UUW90641.1 DUF4244 domain-containing protein [Pimelobacter simplex]UUW94470.1 DUF4244 domain-containing protein [Pimelobacter simplex]